MINFFNFYLVLPLDSLLVLLPYFKVPHLCLINLLVMANIPNISSCTLCCRHNWSEVPSCSILLHNWKSSSNNIFCHLLVSFLSWFSCCGKLISSTVQLFLVVTYHTLMKVVPFFSICRIRALIPLSINFKQYFVNTITWREGRA